MFERFFKNRYGYSRWDGTQRIEGLDADDILKALSDDYLESGNLQQALKRLMQDGIRNDEGRQTMGLRELMERMRNQRNEQLNRYNMASGVMDDLREKLEEIKRMEREGIQRRLDEKSTDQQQQQPGGQQSQAGQQDQQGHQGQPNQPNQQSQQGQQQPSASQSGQQGQEGQSAGGDDDFTPEQKQKMLEMIARRKQEYLEKLPQDVPGQIKGLSEYDFMDDEAREKFQELLQSLQQQMMQQFFQGMQQSLQNMTPEDIAKMREMMQDLMEQLMGDDRIRVDMMELAQNLEALAPMEQARTRFPFRGDESLPFNEAMRMMSRLQQMEGLEDQLNEARRMDNL